MHRGADFIHAAVLDNHSVLVHCLMGMSRSTTVLAAYLIKHQRMPLVEALHLIRKNRSLAYPNLGFWQQLCEFEQAVLGSRSLPAEALIFHRESDRRTRRVKLNKLARQTTGRRTLLGDTVTEVVAAAPPQRATAADEQTTDAMSLLGGGAGGTPPARL